jgi:raffinose/stachyose/melibiose transport system substrate-binding protein
MRTRYVALMLVGFALAGALALDGCAAKKKRDSKPITISWWHLNMDQPSQKAFEAIVADFKTLHPNVEFKIVVVDNIEYKQKLDLELAANDPPDIFHSWGGGGLAEQAKAGYLRDITDWVKSDRWETRVNPVALGLFSHDGRIYGFPHDLGAVGFWYNRDMLAKAGYESFPADWDSFLAMCETLKKGGVTPIALGIADRWPVMYYWVYLTMRVGGANVFRDIYEGKRAFTDPAVVKAGTMMQDLFARGLLPSTCIGDDFNVQSRQMGDGRCAVQLMGQWALAIQAEVSDKKDALVPVMHFAPFPAVRDGKGSVRDAMGGGNGFVIGKNAPDEAIEFLEFFNRASNVQRYFDIFPAVPTASGVSVRVEGLNEVKDYIGSLDQYCLYPDQLFPKDIGILLNETSARVMIGEISADKGAAIMERAWGDYRFK